MKIGLDKNKYSEVVIRKSLYWFSRYCEWIMTDDDESWIVEFSDENSIFLQSQLNRLLNDQILRENLDKSTLYIRRSIITKALKDIDEALGE